MLKKKIQLFLRKGHGRRGPEFEDSSEFFWEYSFAITLSQPATRFSTEESADIPEADRDHLTNGEVLTSV